MNGLWLARIASFVTLACLLLSPAIAETRVTSLERAANGKDWVLDFSSAIWAPTVSRIIVSRCTYNGENCRESEVIDGPDADSVTLTGSGYFEVRLTTPDLFGAFSVDAWVQLVPAIDTADDAIRALAARHAPLLSFHPDEKRFPVSARRLFSDFTVDDLKWWFDIDAIGVSSTEKLADVLALRGSKENTYFIKQDLLQSYVPADREDLPVYWYHEYSSDGRKLFVTYALFYAYDYKGLDPSEEALGDHGLDRESIAVEFDLSAGDWIPRYVYYAGHLETQPTSFLGCASLPACSQPGRQALLGWSGGRVKVSWAAVARRGDRPIAYVARGSHAMFPAVGWYYIDNRITPDLNLTEPAGDTDPSKLVGPSRLIEVDLESDEARFFAFSGQVIDGLSAFANSRITPHLRFPFAEWSASAEDPISNCSACRPYMYRLDAPFIPAGAGPASVSAPAGATVSFVVDAVGSGLLSYQWRRDGVPVPCSSAGDCSRLEWSVAAGDDGARFDVVVSNEAGSVTSDAAILSVDAPSPPGPSPTLAPNLVPRSITFSPASANPSAPVTVTFSIANIGDSPAQASTAVVRITASSESAAGTNLASTEIPALAAGALTTRTVTVNAPASSGSYKVWVIADNGRTSGQPAANEVDDIVSAIGILTVTQAPSGGPDLVAKSVGFDPRSAPPGGIVQVSFVVENVGPASSLATTAQIRVSSSADSVAGSTLLASVAVPALAAGAATVRRESVTVPLAPGAYNVWIVTDSTRAAGQSGAALDNDSTVASTALQVEDSTQPGPDLVVSAISAEPAPITVGGMTVVSFTVTNSGSKVSGVSAAAVRINALANGATGPNLAVTDVPALAPGSSYRHRLGVNVPLIAGDYKVWAVADIRGTAGQVSGAAVANDIASSAEILTVTNRIIPQGGTAEGAYSGTLSGGSYPAFRLLVLEGGEYWGLYGFGSGDGFNAAGFIQGTSSSGSGKFTSSDLRDFGFAPSVSGTGTATFDAEQGTLSGTVTTSRASLSLSGGPVRDVPYEYNMPATMEAVAGPWGLRTNTGDSMVVEVPADGNFSTRTAAGCSLSGTVTPRASGKNVYDVTVRLGAAPCIIPGETLRGVGVIVRRSTGTLDVSQLTIVTVNGSRTIGLTAFGYN